MNAGIFSKCQHLLSESFQFIHTYSIHGFLCQYFPYMATHQSHVQRFLQVLIPWSHPRLLESEGLVPIVCSQVSVTLTGSYYHLKSAGIIVTVATAHATLHCASLAKTAPLAGFCPVGLFTVYLLICSPQQFSCFCSPCLPGGSCSTFKSYFYKKRNNHFLRLRTYYGESRE